MVHITKLLIHDQKSPTKLTTEVVCLQQSERRWVQNLAGAKKLRCELH